MQVKYNVLIVGTTYGSLLGAKLLLAGHSVTFVCDESTAQLINQEGIFVHLPLKNYSEPIILASKDINEVLFACVADDVEPSNFNLVVLAMQESDYKDADIKELVRRTAIERIPCLAIMNMPPIAFLKRILPLKIDDLHDCYVSPLLWEEFEPDMITLATPDPQVFQPISEKGNIVQVSLASNFKVAPFTSQLYTKILFNLASDIKNIRFPVGNLTVALPVKLKALDSVYVPLAIWPMLITGNYRCITTKQGITSIKNAVHDNIQQSEQVYAWVTDLCFRLGANEMDLVPFEKYLQVALKFTQPSTIATALINGALQIERVDCLVQTLGKKLGLQHSGIDEIVNRVNNLVAINRNNLV